MSNGLCIKISAGAFIVGLLIGLAVWLFAPGPGAGLPNEVGSSKAEAERLSGELSDLKSLAAEYQRRAYDNEARAGKLAELLATAKRDAGILTVGIGRAEDSTKRLQTGLSNLGDEIDRGRTILEECFTVLGPGD